MTATQRHQHLAGPYRKAEAWMARVTLNLLFGLMCGLILGAALLRGCP